jgi:ADP-ribose pyrophosphatase
MKKERMAMTKNLTEKTIQTKSIYEGKIISVQLDDVELPNGKKGQREIVKHPGAVAVIPFTSDGKMVVVRQFRKPLEKEIYEIPAGKLEPGEDPHECAKRELEEETGYTSNNFNYVTSFYTSPGFANELLYLYEAEHLTEGQAQPDADEFVEMKQITLGEGLELLKKEQIHDAKTAYALMYWQNKRLLNNK